MFLIPQVSPALLNNDHAEGHVFSRPSGHTCSSHCSPHFPIPCSFFAQIPPNYLADLWPSGRLLEPAPSLQSLTDSLVNSFSVITSIPPYLCLTYFLYKYSLWKTNLSTGSMEKACGSSVCFTVHSVASHFLLFCWKYKNENNKKNLSLPTCSWFSEESQWELVQRRFNSERVTPEEKGDVRKSDASPMGPMGVKMGWGSWGGRRSTQWQSKVCYGTSWIIINCHVLL